MSKRVVVWGTGFVGKMVIAEIVKHPLFELVGVGVRNPGKVGRDVGDICGLAELVGITATDDVDALIALKPDALVHYGPTAAHAEDNIALMTRYTERRTTRFEHQAEIAAVDSWLDFAAAQEDLTAWIGDRAWTTGDGPTALFDAAVAWLRQRRVLLPGVSTLARLVARVRDEATTRLYETLAGLLIGQQARLLEQLLDVEPGERTSRLDAWRRADDEVYRLCRLFGERLSRRVVGLLAPVWSTIGVCAMRCCCNKFVSCARGAPRRKRSPGRWACRQPRSPRWFG